jgi:hypothetical protein
MASLEQVVEFYARGGNFAAENVRDLDPDVGGIAALTEQDKADLVAFLAALTDPRVRFERAPFDHPELILKDGQVGDHQRVPTDGRGNALPILRHRPATGAAGGSALRPFEATLRPAVTVALVSESPAGARVGFVCDKRPTDEVRIELALSDPTRATLSVDEIVFTPADWRVGKELLLTPAAGTSGTVTLMTSRARSLDPEFAGLVVADLELDFAAALHAGDGGALAKTLAPGGASSTSQKP